MWGLYLTIVIICVIFSFFFSASDLTYGIVDKNRLEKEANKGKKSAKLALKIVNEYDRSIASILLGNNFVNIVASSFVTLLGMIWGIEAWISFAFGAFIILFCEFVPKSLAKRFPLQLAMAFAYPVYVTRYVFIISWPLSKMFSFIGKIFKKQGEIEDKIDEEVLTEMVNTIEEEGMLEENEAELVRSAIDLNDIQAFEIMTPRVNVFAIEVNDDIEEIMDDKELFVHSRIPVYEDTIDNIIGILPLKSLLKAKLVGDEINIRSLLYKPLFIPRNHQVLDLLNEFKHEKIHIAVVIDEYGGTEGIVTMEDILEEIVGDIFDESDKVEEEVIDKGNGVYFVDGAMNLDDFFELIEYDEEFETDYSTVAGLCQEILDRFAKVGDEFTFADRYRIKVLEADEFTVEKIRVIDEKFGQDEEE